MTLDPLLSAEIIEELENYIEKIRPPQNIRKKLDISYRIENQSIFIFEIRPRWNNPKEYFSSDIVKTTYVKRQNVWKVYWKRADLKWHKYTPNPQVKSIKEFIRIVEEDAYGCFWG